MFHLLNIEIKSMSSDSTDPDDAIPSTPMKVKVLSRKREKVNRLLCVMLLNIIYPCSLEAGLYWIFFEVLSIMYVMIFFFKTLVPKTPQKESESDSDTCRPPSPSILKRKTLFKICTSYNNNSYICFYFIKKITKYFLTSHYVHHKEVT